MNVSLTRTLAGLALASSVAATTGIGTGGISAHARAGGGLPCPRVACWAAPSLTVSGGMGSLYIRGALFASNHEIELDIYAPVGNYVMEVQAIDTQTNTVVTTYGVPGCIG